MDENKQMHRGQDVLLLNTGLGNDEEQKNIEQLLRLETPGSMDDPGQYNIVVIYIVLYIYIDQKNVSYINRKTKVQRMENHIP